MDFNATFAIVAIIIVLIILFVLIKIDPNLGISMDDEENEKR